MTREQIFSILRQIMLVGGGTFVSRGWFDAVTLNDLVGAILIIIGAGWALYERRGAGLLASAAALPEVRAIVTDATVAASASSDKVVGSGEG
ncbi:hypothetical protein [uncultured Enterovirga sp.]|uniref:Pam3-gp28 family putative phage holin n=1 Tax=uncultured Enterovirga sp. TaxID=2026352 RepID=UPI0035CC8140